MLLLPNIKHPNTAEELTHQGVTTLLRDLMNLPSPRPKISLRLCQTVFMPGLNFNLTHKQSAILTCFRTAAYGLDPATVCVCVCVCISKTAELAILLLLLSLFMLHLTRNISRFWER